MGETPLSRQPFHTLKALPPSVKRCKKRNRIMHVLLKSVQYSGIIELECSLFFTKAPVSIVIYILRCSFCPPTFCKYNVSFWKKKAIKGEKNNTRKFKKKNNFPKLTYKDWNFFFSIAALVFRVPEHVDFENIQKKPEGFLFSS